MLNPVLLIKETISDTLDKIKFKYLPFPLKVEEDELHLKAAAEWLEEASKNGKGGVSSHYSLLKGKWLDPFPETTGYIIPTLFDYAAFSGEKKYYDLAVQLTVWLRSVQLDNGACMQGNYNEKKGKTNPIIFNTGQNILGFVRAFAETGINDFFDSAVKAGNFLVESTDADGVWDKNLHRGLKHTINTRTAWALLELNKIKPDQNYLRVAVANLNWAVAQQTPNAWFNYGTSRIGGLPNTHFLSYTCEGLIESYKILKDEKYLNAAVRTAEKMMRIFEIRKMLYAFWDEKWKNRGKYIRNSSGRYVCVTGNIQISIVWMMLYRITGDIRFLNSAFKMLDFIKTTQDINSVRKGVRGAIKGSYPVYGGYSTLSYPNWAAKYFCDAILLKIDLKKEVEKKYSPAVKEVV